MNTRTSMTPDAADFNRLMGDRICGAREAAGLSQAGLAARLRAGGATIFHQTTMARIESGERPLRFQEAIAIAGALSLSLDQMAGQVEAAGLEVKAGLDLAIAVLMRERGSL